MRRLAAAVPLLLSACMVGPDYRRPEIDAPAAFQYAPADATDTSGTRWWEQFKDPALDQLITEALAHNTDVAIAVANVEQASAILTQTRSALFPQIGYGGTAEREKIREPSFAALIPGFDNPADSYEAGLTASWEIDLWGRIRRLTESARANLYATEEARLGVIQSVVAAVANNYLQLRGLDDQLAIARKTLETYAESVRIFKLQFQYGEVSQMNVAQAESQYETAAAQIPLLESQIAQSQNALAVLVGRNPGPVDRGLSVDDMTLPSVPSGAPSSLLERRPDLRQAEQQLIAANAQIGAAKALYFPSISLTGALGGASAELSDLFDGDSRVWNYSGTVIGPIFTFGAVSGQVAQATASQKAALLNYELAIRNAFADVDNALVANQKIRDQLAAQARLVKALQEYALLARMQFDGGYTDYTTVLQAEQALFPAELQLAAVRASLLSSAVNVYQTMGGGWVTEADSLTTGQNALPAP